MQVGGKFLELFQKHIEERGIDLDQLYDKLLDSNLDFLGGPVKEWVKSLKREKKE
jgi:hypothetical protein